MDWFTIPPSAPWQWITLIASFIALGLALMALPTVFQMIWGQPKVRIDFGIQELIGASILQCELYNLPVKCKALQKMGIRRMVAEDVVAHFSIKMGNNTLAAIVPDILSHTGTKPAQRVSMPPSIFPLQFGIASIIEGKSLVKVFGEDIILKPNIYRVFIAVHIEGKTFKKQHNLRVIDKPPFAYWDVDS